MRKISRYGKVVIRNKGFVQYSQLYYFKLTTINVQDRSVPDVTFFRLGNWLCWDVIFQTVFLQLDVRTELGPSI